MKIRRVLSAMVIFAAGAGAGYFTALFRTQPEVRQYCSELIARGGERIEGFLNRFIPNSAGASAAGPSAKSPAEAPPEPVEVRSAYIRESLLLSDLSAKADSTQAQISSVSGKIKNAGNRVLGRVLLTAYFMRAGEIVFETTLAPLGEAPLKQDETREFTCRIENIPPGVANLRASITDISFLP